MSGMNWKRVHWESQSRRYGSANVKDETDGFGRDRAARWPWSTPIHPRSIERHIDRTADEQWLAGQSTGAH